mgnify:CR=1 FL=1
MVCARGRARPERQVRWVFLFCREGGARAPDGPPSQVRPLCKTAPAGGRPAGGFGGLREAVKAILSAEQALSPIRSGARVMVGGFGLVGAPLTLLDALSRMPVKDLEIVSNNLGEPGRGLGILLRNGQIRKAIGSFFTSNAEVVEAYRQGRLEVELLPQGTLAEAIRAAGAGIRGFYVRAGAGTLLAQGRERRRFDDGEYVFHEALRADVALVRALRADRLGNLVYYKTARNFNPLMATAADYVVAEVDEVVEVDAIDPEAVVTPHLYVDALVISRYPFPPGRRVER